jgi:hypothetical protein
VTLDCLIITLSFYLVEQELAHPSGALVLYLHFFVGFMLLNI